MKILILNWRDIKNPQSGGAEILTHEMAKRWVKWGHQVTQFSAAFPGCQKKEIIDGVKLIRQGATKLFSLKGSVHLAAFWFYQKHFRGKIDVVVEEIHGLPFLTPLYVREKKVVLICEIAQEIWDYVFPFPLNILGRLQEKIYFKFYWQIPFLTISPSTKKDLMKYGVKEKKIHVLPMGFNKPKLKKLPAKEKKPTLLFVGRLAKTKGVEDAIKAFRIIKKEFPEVILWVVGKGNQEYTSYLKNLAKKFGQDVVFWGFVSEKKKWKLMAKAHLIVVPSVREGWGLIVPETGLAKTPAVIYNVPGLRDVVEDGVNGLICQDNTFSDLAKQIMRLLNDKRLYKNLSKKAQKKSKEMNWEDTARTALKVFAEK